MFIASGATVKPSYYSLKSLQREEAKQWISVTTKAIKSTTKKYEPQIKPIQDKLDLRGAKAPSAEEKKQLRNELKSIEEKIAAEVKATVKKEFNYQIPIAEVKRQE